MIDPKEYQKRLDRITAIFSEMAVRADAVSLQRCPYKDRNNRCTALFGCRNQRKAAPEEKGDPDLAVCSGDDKLDYRSAWETHPEAVEKVRQTLANRRKSREKEPPATS